MKYTLVSGILFLSALKNSLALPAPTDYIRNFIGTIFDEVYDNCKKEEGTFYFRDYENSICLKQKSGGVVDFSENTEIVGTHFARSYHSGYQLVDNNTKLVSYSWYECDSTNARYNQTTSYDSIVIPYDHERCMKDASKFRTAENPAGLKFIDQLISCENPGNAFYYRNDPNDDTKFDYVCLEEHPLNYYYVSSSSIYKKDIPKNCIVKDNQFVCGVDYSINGVKKSLSKYDYEKYSDTNEFYKLLVNAIYETESMNRYDLSEIDYNSDSDTKTSVTIFNPERNVSVAIKNPENVKKMTMHCYGQYGGSSKKGKTCFIVEGTRNIYECYNFYTEIPNSNSCYVYTQHASPIATSTVTSQKCSTIATYRTIVGHSIGPTFTMSTFCDTETHIYNPYTYKASYTTPAVEPPKSTITPTPSTCNHGYPCCKKCGKIYYVDSDASWGVENNEWCEYLPDCLE